jgi:hypothetical protein
MKHYADYAQLLKSLCLAGAGPEPAHTPLPLRSAVQDKNFYLLSMIERTTDVAAALKSDARFAKWASERRAALSKAASSCGNELACYAAAVEWKDEDMRAAADALREMYGKNAALRKLVDGPLRLSGMFVRYQAGGGDELLAQAWMDAARGLNHTIAVYGTGAAPRYPQIDSIYYDVKSPGFLQLMRTLAAVLDEDRNSMTLFFQPSLRFAMHLLDASHRDEAGRLEPLELGENAAAVRRVRTIAWSKFPYSAIVVPGSGADRPGTALSAMGKLRLTLAARRFREGKAPLILVSGGYVHPAQTPYAEAVEMKKSLIADFGIPADAILVDPHARHTTTNVRNAGRQIYRYGMPFGKAALIVTDPDQSRGIESQAFADRCMRELGYKPYRLGARLSIFDLEFFPVIECLQGDAMDPLDP